MKLFMEKKTLSRLFIKLYKNMSSYKPHAHIFIITQTRSKTNKD